MFILCAQKSCEMKWSWFNRLSSYTRELIYCGNGILTEADSRVCIRSTDESTEAIANLSYQISGNYTKTLCGFLISLFKENHSNMTQLRV